MKLQQLRYAVETYRRNLNVSEAAEALFTSQPGVSKQIRLLEEELGIQIFIRSGKRMVAVTQAGHAVLTLAEQILRDVGKIKKISSDFANHNEGVLHIAATPTLVQHALPLILRNFSLQYPDVKIHLRQATPEQLHEMVLHGETDFAICHQMWTHSPDIRRILGKTWAYALVLPENHVLTQNPNLTLADIVQHDLLVYDYAMQSPSPLHKSLGKLGLLEQARVAFAANSSDVLLEYVRLGWGVAIVDAMSVQAADNLVVRDISHLFEPTHWQIWVRQDNLLRDYAHDFIGRVLPENDVEHIKYLLHSRIENDFSI